MSDVPSADRGERARADVSDGDEFDPFADWQNSPPVKYPEGCETPSDKTWYLIGRSHGKEEQFTAMMPVIEEIIEKVSR